MNILIYALSAVLAGVLAIRAPFSAERDPVRRSFAVLATTLALCYTGFTLHLLLDPPELKYLSRVAAGLVAPALLAFIEDFFGSPGAPRSPWGRRLSISAFPVMTAFIASDFYFAHGTDAPASPHSTLGWSRLPELLFASYVFLGLGAALSRLFELHESTVRPVEKARIRYLLMFAGAALGFSMVEALLRLVPVEVSSANVLARAVLMQGAFPPLGAVCSALFLYFVHQRITEQRGIEPGEVLSRLAAVGTAALVLVGIEALSVAFIGQYWVHGTFQALVASMLFLFAYDPLRTQLERWMGNVFNRRAQRLEDSIHELDEALSRVISLDALSNELLGRLLESGRVRSASLYLWDEDRRAYGLVAERGPLDEPPILQVSRQPFTDGFAAGERAYLRGDLERLVERDARRAEAMDARLGTLRQLNADVVLPFSSGDVVLGWLALQDGPEGEGFTEDEVVRLSRTVNRASVILENLHGFEKLKEEHRLAALGTMATGLAHEIRNPLAGIRGAAQFLQGSREGTDAEMVQVIIDEVDRLSQVVSQFLDYARPYQVNREVMAVQALVTRVTGVVRASPDAEEIEIVEEIPEGLPTISVDAVKLNQVLLNLCQNAVQAMKRGGTLTLRASVAELRDPKARRGPALEIAVVDTGDGITKENLDKLFVPFFTTRHDGTGLGLAISRRIMQAHGGELDVTSAPGRGSTFTLRVPITELDGSA